MKFLVSRYTTLVEAERFEIEADTEEQALTFAQENYAASGTDWTKPEYVQVIGDSEFIAEVI